MNARMVINILQNLTNFEQDYLEKVPDLSKFKYYKTYADYLNNHFIKQHELAKFYWLQPNDVSISIPTMVFNVLDESVMLLNNINISVAKQINFPVDFYQKCNYFDILYIYKGSAALQWNEQTFALKEGDLFFIAPGVSYRTDPHIKSICLHIMMRRQYIADHFQNYFDHNSNLRAFFEKTFSDKTRQQYLLYHTNKNETISELIMKMFAEYINNELFINDVMHNYLNLLFTFIERYSNLDTEISFQISTTEINYQTFLDYLKSHYRTATLSSLAEHTNFSKQYVCRIVKKIEGCTFSELLNRIKVARAKDYMIGTTLTLEVIAELTGFPDASSLSRMFKKICGVSPSVFRKNI